MRSSVVEALRAIVLCLWPMTVAAAGESLGATLGAVTLADWLSVVVLSSVSGLVALLHRVRRAFEAAAQAVPGAPPSGDMQPIDWRLFTAAHMTGSLFVGGIAFLLLAGADINNYLKAAGIALSSWSGAKLADRWADAFQDRLGAVIGGSKGGQP